MSNLIRVCIEDIVYFLGQEPFVYLVGMYMVYISVCAIQFIIKGGD